MPEPSGVRRSSGSRGLFPDCLRLVLGQLLSRVCNKSSHDRRPKTSWKRISRGTGRKNQLGTPSVLSLELTCLVGFVIFALFLFCLGCLMGGGSGGGDCQPAIEASRIFVTLS